MHVVEYARLRENTCKRAAIYVKTPMEMLPFKFIALLQIHNPSSSCFTTIHSFGTSTKPSQQLHHFELLSPAFYYRPVTLHHTVPFMAITVTALRYPRMECYIHALFELWV